MWSGRASTSGGCPGCGAAELTRYRQSDEIASEESPMSAPAIPLRLTAPDPGWTVEADVVVVGSGIAGLTVALRYAELVPRARVLVVTKDVLAAGSTRWAQGGIAAVLDPADTPDEHLNDTLHRRRGPVRRRGRADAGDRGAGRAAAADGPRAPGFDRDAGRAAPAHQGGRPPAAPDRARRRRRHRRRGAAGAGRGGPRRRDRGDRARAGARPAQGRARPGRPA